LDGLARAKHQGKKMGRPKGSKDSYKRRKGGYLIRHAKERQKEDKKLGINRNVEHYLENPPLNNKNKKKHPKVPSTPPVKEVSK